MSEYSRCACEVCGRSMVRESGCQATCGRGCDRRADEIARTCRGCEEISETDLDADGWCETCQADQKRIAGEL